MVRKLLYRSRTNRVLGGICGGLGEYLDIDPTVIRLVWVVIVIFTGIVPGILAYLLLLLIVPEKKS